MGDAGAVRALILAWRLHWTVNGPPNFSSTVIRYLESTNKIKPANVNFIYKLVKAAYYAFMDNSFDREVIAQAYTHPPGSWGVEGKKHHRQLQFLLFTKIIV